MAIDFLNPFIEKLYLLDDTEKSRLRRVSNPSNDSRVYDILVRMNYTTPDWAQSKIDMITVLYSNAYQCNETEEKTFNLGKTLKYCDFSEIRMKSLLSTDSENLFFKLRQAVKRLNKEQIAINWTKLSHDIIQWDHDSKFVQRNWAKGFFTDEAINKEN